MKESMEKQMEEYYLDSQDLVYKSEWEILCEYAGVHPSYGSPEVERDFNGFENETFVIRPYDWNEPDYPEANFEYKPTGFKLWWYKYAFRSPHTNQKISVPELLDIFKECAKTVYDPEKELKFKKELKRDLNQLVGELNDVFKKAQALGMDVQVITNEEGDLKTFGMQCDEQKMTLIYQGEKEWMKEEQRQLERILEKAIEIATKAHEGQLDKSGKPYIGHPMRVMNQLESIECKILGVLHDTLEDCDITVDELHEAGIPMHLVDLLEELTKGKGESYFDYIDRVSYDERTCLVKLSDLKDNMDLTRLYPDIDVNRLTDDDYLKETLAEKDYRRQKKYEKAKLELEASLMKFERTNLKYCKNN